MFYKSILNAVAVVVAVMAVMFVGCGGDDNPAGGGDKLAGDWSMLEMQYVNSDGSGGVSKIPDDAKVFYSFRSSNLTTTQFEKISDFWVESVNEVGPYHIKGDSMCVVEGEGTSCVKYNVSGNTLTLSSSYSECWEGECYSSTTTGRLQKGDVAKFKRDIGNSLKSRDPKLNQTGWVRPSSDPDCEWCGNDRINFWGGYDEYPEIYLSDSYDATWYTDGNNLMLVSLKCDRFETVTDDDGYEWEECVSTSVDKTVPLEYQLTNGNETLRLRAAGGDWDEWEKGDPYGYSQSKAKAKKGKRAVSPFWAFQR